MLLGYIMGELEKPRGQFWNVSAHALTAQQEASLESLGCDGHIEHVRMGSVNPNWDTEAVDAFVRSQLVNIVIATERVGDDDGADGTSHHVAMVAGEPIATVCAVRFLQSLGVRCVAATTERVSQETTTPGGVVLKVGEFKFVRWRDFPKL
ncbi:hypothetical protein EBT31_06485 [bacterium]|nr:hypothetical protein [bacterium]